MYTSLLVLIVAAGGASVAHAGDVAVGAYVGHLGTPAAADLPSASTAGLRLRYYVDDNWAVEGSAGGFGTSNLHGVIDPRLEIQRFFGSTPYDNIRPFLAGGFGVLAFDGRGHDLWDAGLGLNAALWPALDFRGDLRYRILRTYQSEAWPKSSESGFFLTAGLELHPPHAPPPPPPPPPDTDGDGFLDAQDVCPTEPEDVDGTLDQDGCPDPDNDNDGIYDGSDSCPSAPEDPDQFEDENGCPDPDNDQDRVPDERDAAPNAPETYNGYQDRDGAPDEIPQELQKFTGKIEGIKFETGKSVIQRSSNKTLDAAASVLVKFPEIRVEVQGHTDDVGDDARNLTLSQARAQAVVDYLVGKGVALDHLVARGYGETQPTVPNDSTANRALNRRVEFVILKD